MSFTHARQDDPFGRGYSHNLNSEKKLIFEGKIAAFGRVRMCNFGIRFLSGKIEANFAKDVNFSASRADPPRATLSFIDQ